MTTHTSATAQEETPHETETTKVTISDATKRRAKLKLIDVSIDPQWRNIIRGALELEDPCLAELVIRAEAGEDVVDTFESLRTSEADEDDPTIKKIEALAEIICGVSDERTAAMFVLMATLEDSTDPEELASIAKHFAFCRCAESNLYGIVDAQIAAVEGALLGSSTLVS